MSISVGDPVSSTFPESKEQPFSYSRVDTKKALTPRFREGLNNAPRPTSCPMRIARRFLITGRVQGVGFRYFTQRAASQHGIAGWVRNTADGRVEIDAEGDAEALRQFEREISVGPAGARVDHVDSLEVTAGPAKSSFVIR